MGPGRRRRQDQRIGGIQHVLAVMLPDAEYVQPRPVRMLDAAQQLGNGGLAIQRRHARRREKGRETINADLHVLSGILLIYIDSKGSQ